MAARRSTVRARLAPPKFYKMKKSISLIGMAGAGKSSLGKELAKHFDLTGGAKRVRTVDLLAASQTLSQLSYSPKRL